MTVISLILFEFEYRRANLRCSAWWVTCRYRWGNSFWRTKQVAFFKTQTITPLSLCGWEPVKTHECWVSSFSVALTTPTTLVRIIKWLGKMGWVNLLEDHAKRLKNVTFLGVGWGVTCSIRLIPLLWPLNRALHIVMG